MESIITITPEYNVDKDTNKIITESLVFKIKRPWRSFIQIYNAKVKRKYAVSVANISVFDHRIILEETPHVILYMVSKRIETINPAY